MMMMMVCNDADGNLYEGEVDDFVDKEKEDQSRDEDKRRRRR
jgi:hypothetical protein